MRQRCPENVWWPSLTKDIESYVKECEPCVLSDKSVKPTHPPIQPIPWPTKPWEYISVDIVGEIHTAPHNQLFLLVVHDLHSKWPEVATMSQITSTVVIRLLEDLFA